MKFDSLKTLLLEGKRDAIERFVNTGKIPKDVFDRLLEYDPTEQKKYIEWMCKTYVKEHPTLNMYSVIKQFDDYATRNQITQKDIYSYPTLEAVIDVVNMMEDTTSKTQQKKAKAGIKDYEKDIDPNDIIFKNDKVIIVLPKTKEASIKYGRGSRWCTAADSGGNMFNSYRRNSHVNLYYFIPIVDVTPFAMQMEDEIKEAMAKRRSVVRTKKNVSEEAVHNLEKVAVAVYTNGKKEAFYNDDSRLDEDTLNKFAKWLGIEDSL